MGGYFDENALAPEDEVAQILDQGPIGIVDANALGPGDSDEFMSSKGNMLMDVELMKKGAKQKSYNI